jgi:lipopolysaccharide transport system ATP-binding protein
MSWVIKAEQLGKKYLIGHQKKSTHDTLRDTIVRTGHGLWHRLHHPLSPNRQRFEIEEFWALKHIDLDVEQRARLGIIGRNGAGKSTLLKILSRITHPTTGKVRIRGRVASLLQVGTGFHPELTGRENIYLNGAILGMTKRDIIQRFDEIVSFAEVEKFLDTPVKRYSSGMYVRLAFAVAAHLEPEILLVDEVLAVGDAAFQKKCLGKMGKVADEGRTIVFVSHNMLAIKNLCDHVLWLHQGQVIEQGDSQTIVSHYLESDLISLTSQLWEDRKNAPGNEKVKIHQIKIHPEDDPSNNEMTMESRLEIGIHYWQLVDGIDLDVTLQFFTEENIMAFPTSTRHTRQPEQHSMQAGLYHAICHIPANLLNSGAYRITVHFVQDASSVIFRYEDILQFTVNETENSRGTWYGKRPGVVRPVLPWERRYVSAL